MRFIKESVLGKKVTSAKSDTEMTEMKSEGAGGGKTEAHRADIVQQKLDRIGMEFRTITDWKKVMRNNDVSESPKYSDSAGFKACYFSKAQNAIDFCEWLKEYSGLLEESTPGSEADKRALRDVVKPWEQGGKPLETSEAYPDKEGVYFVHIKNDQLEYLNSQVSKKIESPRR